MAAEAKLLRDIRLLRNEIAEIPSGKRQEVRRLLMDEEMKVRMAAMARTRMPASPMRRAVREMGTFASRMVRRFRRMSGTSPRHRGKIL
jgi:hypothetical protein